MPWLAERDGELIAPDDATSTDTLTCPDCDNPLYVRAAHTRSDGTFVARHFSHYPSDTSQSSGGHGDCPGESDPHQRFKSITLSKLRHRFEDYIDDIDYEVTIGDRRADLAATFTTDLEDLGGLLPAHGAIGTQLAVEVQYRHEQKDTQAVTHDFLNHGYSVLWLAESQFTGKDVNLLDGPGQTWVPVYPAILDPTIHAETNAMSACWHTHRDHLTTQHSPTTTVPAAVPPHWVESELKNHLATTGTGPQYRRWATLFPELAEEYRRRAEAALEDPDALGQSLTQRLYPLCRATAAIQPNAETIPCANAVCGNCRHHETDEYRSGREYIICWQNQPPDASNRPRKLTRDDDFALDCPSFSYWPWLDEHRATDEGIHPKLRKPWFIDALRGAGPLTRQQRKAALKYAYYQTWGREDWCDLVFSPAREEALLRERGSVAARPPDEDCS